MAGLVPLPQTTIEIEVFARETGLHPETVLRLVRLGLVEPAGGSDARPLFDDAAEARLARALRLRRDLGLNYSGAALASELLSRIEELEERLRRYEPPPPQRPRREVITWTRIV
jgi:DNA-binding transcriptional MerR regulator